MTPPKPEAKAREAIDAALVAAGWVVQDQEPKDDRWKSRYVEPAEPEPESGRGGELPEGWCWASLDHVADIQGGIQKGK
jgi:hypothetical protein